MKNETLELHLTEWYEGDICANVTKRKDKFILKERSPDLIIEEIKRIVPEHFHFIEDTDDIIGWLEGNRDFHGNINDSILIGDTDTMDIQEAFDNHLNTLGGFTGTEYDLWHIIEE